MTLIDKQQLMITIYIYSDYLIEYRSYSFISSRLNESNIINSNNIGVWLIGGCTHKSNGPAIIYSDGSKKWAISGYSYRLDAPAIINANGDKYWYIDDELIRIDDYN